MTCVCPPIPRDLTDFFFLISCVVSKVMDQIPLTYGWGNVHTLLHLYVYFQYIMSHLVASHAIMKIVKSKSSLLIFLSFVVIVFSALNLLFQFVVVTYVCVFPPLDTYISSYVLICRIISFIIYFTKLHLIFN